MKDFVYEAKDPKMYSIGSRGLVIHSINIS